ncbi:octapeptide-repeat protein T2-like [Pleurodeles waltl]|uniref:octapeptide-repeat protein T2-like n=1 Tax=Pleurodeles waltl TaxID=8319 RepID=UPI0037095F09
MGTDGLAFGTRFGIHEVGSGEGGWVAGYGRRKEMGKREGADKASRAKTSIKEGGKSAENKQKREGGTENEQKRGEKGEENKQKRREKGAENKKRVKKRAQMGRTEEKRNRQRAEAMQQRVMEVRLDKWLAHGSRHEDLLNGITLRPPLSRYWGRVRHWVAGNCKRREMGKGEAGADKVRRAKMSRKRWEKGSENNQKRGGKVQKTDRTMKKRSRQRTVTRQQRLAEVRQDRRLSMGS